MPRSAFFARVAAVFGAGGASIARCVWLTWVRQTVDDAVSVYHTPIDNEIFIQLISLIPVVSSCKPPPTYAFAGAILQEETAVCVQPLPANSHLFCVVANGLRYPNQFVLATENGPYRALKTSTYSTTTRLGWGCDKALATRVYERPINPPVQLDASGYCSGHNSKPIVLGLV